MNPTIEYNVSFDGIVFKTIKLTYEQYKDQRSRDIVRRELAHELLIPPHYLRLTRRHRSYIHVPFEERLKRFEKERKRNEKRV